VPIEEVPAVVDSGLGIANSGSAAPPLTQRGGPADLPYYVSAPSRRITAERPVTTSDIPL